MIVQYTRTPDFEIEIRRPNYSLQNYEDTLLATFSSVKTAGNSTACIGYSFSDSLNTIDTPFSLSFTLERDKDGYTWYDKIHARDLVFIKEHGKTRFVGYVTHRRYQARMGDKGAQRTITIDGTNIGGFLSSYSIILDLHILSSNVTAETASRKFMASIGSKVEQNQTMSELIKAVVSSYLSMINQIGNIQNSGIIQIIDKFFDIGSKFSSDIKAKYPMALALYETGENSLWNILQQIVTPPFHEFYGVWNPAEGSNKFELRLRPTPFDPANWVKLPINNIPDDIPSVFLQDYDFGDSDTDTKTMFGCFLPGSSYSREKSLTLSNFDYTMKTDIEKWPYYGYKPLFTELRFFNRSEEKTFTPTKVSTLMQELSQQLYDWFHNNASFLTGSVTIMNVQNDNYSKYPLPGERLGFLGGEFYIEEVRRQWQYGGAMTATLGISRGYGYTQEGVQDHPLDKIGQKVGVLEAENA
jgi:hypothetical protein